MLLASLTGTTASTLLPSSQCYVAANSTDGGGRRLLQLSSSSSYYTLYLLPPDSLAAANALAHFLATTAYTGPRSSLALPSQVVNVRVACDEHTDVAVGGSCPGAISVDLSSSSSSSVSSGVVAGLAIAGLVVLLLSCVVTYVVLARCKRPAPPLASHAPALHIAINSSLDPYEYDTGSGVSADIHLTSNNIHLTSANFSFTPSKTNATPSPAVATPVRTYQMPSVLGAPTRGGRLARPMNVTDFLFSLSIPTPSVAPSEYNNGEDSDGSSSDSDSDSEQIGWRGGGGGGGGFSGFSDNRGGGGGAMFVMDAKTEADLFAGAGERVQVADMSISATERANPEVLVYIHDD